MSDDRRDKRWVVVGKQGTGKTIFVKSLVHKYLSAKVGVLIIDPLSEYEIEKATIFRPENHSAPQAEVELALKMLVVNPFIEKQPKQYGFIVFEECTRYFPNRQPLPAYFGYLNDYARHVPVGMCFVGRRFSQMHTDISELAHVHIIYRQDGVNDLQRCDEMKKGLSERVENLKEYHYIELNEKGEISEHSPVNYKLFQR
jgi:hypothetical protein